MSIPGGYVVPVGSNVTFTCSSSLGGVSWTLDLKVPGGTAKSTASAGLARSIPQVSSPDSTPSANPATITIHNVVSENNQSTVQCIDTIMSTEVSTARVIVEGKGLNTALYIQSTNWNGIQGNCISKVYRDQNVYARMGNATFICRSSSCIIYYVWHCELSRLNW